MSDSRVNLNSPVFKYLVANKNDRYDPASQSEWAAKKLIWVPHETQGFCAASIRAELGDELEVELVETNKKMTVSRDDIQKMNPPNFDRVDDMADLTCLNEACVLHNIKERYYSGLIYTYSGLFCVVVNPYKKLPIYTDQLMEGYKGRKKQEVPPHIYAVADSSYRHMLQDKEDQSILCTGESGAGKTENTKKVIQYLAFVAAPKPRQSSSASSTLHSPPAINMTELERQLLQANPILEAFGNAKTVKNDNSSRFGKFIRINFDASGYISGANIETYLLEKSRAIRQAKDERSFHIFYQLLAGASVEQINELLLEDVGGYEFLSQGNITVPGIEESEEFRTTLQAMQIMGFSNEDIKSIFKVLSAVLLFGNMHFKQERNTDQATLPDNRVAQKVSHLLGIGLLEMSKAFLKPKMKVGREMVNKAQTKEQCEFAVEAIAKALYERLFKWIVHRINRSLDRSTRQGTSFIGILDIAGFEIFGVNSFEQLCINYTNEKLQQLFNHTMFILEQEEYQAEGIEWKFIDFGLDLQPTIDLIENRSGVLAILDEECIYPKATDRTFVDKLQAGHETHPKFIKSDRIRSGIADADFSIVHYAGSVVYSARQWLEKNMDPLNDNVVQNLQQSQDPFVAALWKDAEIISMGATLDGTFGPARVRKGMMRTVAMLYKEQLAKLMDTLSNTNANFVRCIIPNHEKKAGRIDPLLVLDQLRCNGVLEGIRICRQGFPNRIPFSEFRQRYELLTPNVIPKGYMDGKSAVEKMVKALELDNNLFRIGKSKIFFRTGVLAGLEEERDIKISDLIIQFQAYCRGLLARRMYQRRMQQLNAIRIIQRNCASYLKLRNWPWWRLYTKVKPLLQVTKQEEKLFAKDEELKQVRDKFEKSQQEMKEVERSLQQALEEKATLSEQLQNETELCAEAEEIRGRLLARKQELEHFCHELESRLEEEDEKIQALTNEKKKLQQHITDLEEQLEEEEGARQKLQIEKYALDGKIKKLEEGYAILEDSNGKIQKEKKMLDDRLKDVEQTLQEEEEKCKQLSKLKAKQEATIVDLEERLRKELDVRQELERGKRKLDTEVSDIKEQLNEKKAQLEEMQTQLIKKEDELNVALVRCDEETLARSQAQKALRELESQMSDIQEDLESEKAARQKSEKQKRDLNEELERLKNELLDSLDSTATQKELQKQREHEVAALKKALEDEMAAKEAQVSELRAKHHLQVEQLSEQTDQLRKQKASLEKAKQHLEAENIDMANEIKGHIAAKQESERRRKALEHQLQEASAKQAEAERLKQDQIERCGKMQAELESVYVQLEELDKRATAGQKNSSNLEAQLAEVQELLQEETKQKLALSAKLRLLEADKQQLQEQLDEEEEAKRNMDKQMQVLQAQITEAKKKSEDEGEQALEEQRKKFAKELDSANAKLAEHLAQVDKLDKSKRKLLAEVEDLNIELDSVRSKVCDLEKKQRKFDSLLAEEKAHTERVMAEKDQVERESREKETRLLALTRDLEEKDTMIEQLETARRQQNAELESLVNTQGSADRNLHELEKARRTLENQLTAQKQRLEELEDELQLAEDAKLRMEVNLQAMRSQFERDMAARDEQAEEKRRSLLKSIRDLEGELEEERKQRSAAQTHRKKLEADINDMEHQLELANKSKDDANRAFKKMAASLKDFQREYEEAKAGKEELIGAAKDADKRAKLLEAEVTQLQEDLASAERARRSAESERDDLQEELSATGGRGSFLAEEKKKLEARILQLEEDLEEEQSNGEILVEKMRKAQNQIEAVTNELSQERNNSARLENSNAALERQIKEMRAKLQEIETSQRNKIRSAVSHLETRVSQFEEQLDLAEQEKQTAQRMARKLEKRMKDAVSQVDDERRNGEQLKEQIEKVTNRLRTQKRQFDEIDEECSREKAHRRKLQREIEELQEQNDKLQADLASARNKLRRAGGGRFTGSTPSRGDESPVSLPDDSLASSEDGQIIQ
ncbi:myosin heavy chain, non-muscle-like isoform X1 [Varroa destructor]|uniref:Uncharacterized protein n=1 Tax=Varroa destructor TaxID=109461 RepID=A0A7M7J9B9_VARDE|nr:myosin heavy chain, non-muscle-like isoform X1 [Varroa destructor]XP_022648626.1 myosin heavy chain, non-muscle-like isoform X1 [Varroa destructor]